MPAPKVSLHVVSRPLRLSPTFNHLVFSSLIQHTHVHAHAGLAARAKITPSSARGYPPRARRSSGRNLQRPAHARFARDGGLFDWRPRASRLRAARVLPADVPARGVALVRVAQQQQQRADGVVRPVAAGRRRRRSERAWELGGCRGESKQARGRLAVAARGRGSRRRGAEAPLERTRRRH